MKIVKRKRDGKLYRTTMIPCTQPGFARRGDCYLLEPHWDGRTHYKTVPRFKAEYTYADGSAIE